MLPWYLCDRSGFVLTAWKFFIQFMNWSSIIVVPLALIFPEVQESTYKFMWFIDIVWCVEIILNFFRASSEARNFKQTALGYIKDQSIGFGAFWFDTLATIPPMVFKEQDPRVNLVKLLRFYHFSAMLEPIAAFIAFCMRGHKSNFIDAITSFFTFIIGVCLMVHFVACCWISIGKSHDNLPVEERASWISDPNSDFVDMKWY